VDERSFWRRGLEFVLDIGADPADDDYTRTVKRIYWAASALGVLTAFGSTVWYFLSGDAALGWLFFFSFVFFIGLFVEGIEHPKRFNTIVLVLLVYFVVASALVTLMRGGIWKTDGAIMIGLMGPLLGLVFLRDRRPVVVLFLVYCAIVMGLAILEPGSSGSRPVRLDLDPFKFWAGFVIVAAFVFGVIYFFVIQREKTHRELAEEKEKSERLLRRIGADLAQAARIQQDLLPKASPRLEGFDIAGLNIPCYEVGGDYYDFVPIDADRLGVVIADVSGKGIGASLLMASLRAALLAEIQPGYALERLASRLSEFVFKSTGPSSFVTFLFAEIDRRAKELRYVNAGHNPPFVLGREGRFSSLEPTGFPLGMFAGSGYESRAFPFAAGDLAVLFTDGIPDGRNAEGEDYSEGRLRSLVLANAGLSAAEICRKIIEDVGGYACGAQPCDDMTLVVVKRTAI